MIDHSATHDDHHRHHDQDDHHDHDDHGGLRRDLVATRLRMSRRAALGLVGRAGAALGAIQLLG